MDNPTVLKLARELYDQRLTCDFVSWEQLPDSIKQMWYDKASAQIAATRANHIAG